MSTPIWLDCDTGHDDAYAILLAAYHPKARLLGVSTVHGNAPLDYTHENTRAVLHAIGSPDVPVLKGANRPVSREPSFAADIHGESGLGGVTLLPQLPPSDVSHDVATTVAKTAEIILAQPPNTVYLVATGPLTNIYNLVKANPEIVDHLAGFSVMGGAVGGGYTDAPLGTVEGEGERFGNWTPWAEFNIYADPEAASFVLANEGLANKTTMVGLDLSHQVRGNDAVQRLLFTEHDPLSYIRQLFREVLMFFHGTYKTQFGIMDGPPLHDPVAVYAILVPEAFDDNNGERWRVDVDVSADKYNIKTHPTNHVGQTSLKQSPYGVRVPRHVDLPAFWTVIDQALAKAEQATSAS